MHDPFQRHERSDSPPNRLRPQFRLSVTACLLAANALWWLFVELRGSTQDPESLLAFGANYGPLVAEGEYWRLLTSTFLHIGIMHLAFNSIGLLIYGMLLERIFGRLRFLLIYVASGLAGATVSFVVNPIAISAGASGAIFGLLGALGATFLAGPTRANRRDFGGIVVLIAINLAFGFMVPGIDNWAHIGGLVMGFALGMVLTEGRGQPVVHVLVGSEAFAPRPRRSPTRLALALPPVALLLVAGAWLGSASLEDTPAGRVAAAERLYDDGRYADALAEADAAIAAGADTGDAFLARALILEKLGDDRGAAEDLGRAVRRGLSEEDTRTAIALLVALGGE